MPTTDQPTIQPNTQQQINLINGQVVSLKEYIESRLTSIAESTRVRADALESRFQSVNEFRAALSDQAAQFVTRREMESKIDKLCGDIEGVGDDIKNLDAFKNQLQGKANQSAVNIAYLFSAGSLLLAIIALLKDFIH